MGSDGGATPGAEQAATWALRGAAFCAVAVGLGLLFQACAHLPPRNPDDLCSIFRQNHAWRQAAEAASARWDVPVPVLMAVLYQESRFRADARPGWRRFLGLVPTGRLSTAYGYGQVKDGTWRDYRRATGRRDARRDSFADAVDFVGWYADVIHRVAGVPKSDAYDLYLAYHEGPGGFGRGSHDAKAWLLGVARKVKNQSRSYDAQWASCGGPARSPAASRMAAGGGSDRARP